MASARDDPHWMNSVPKFGTVVPNRVFVGGISGNTKEDDLMSLFSQFGNVTSTKIIVDKAGISKGYGFVTYETKEEAQKVLNEMEWVTFKDRKLNIAPAMKKQLSSRRSLESNSVLSTSMVFPSQPFPALSGYSSSGFYRDLHCYPRASWPIIWPTQYNLQQEFQPTANLQSAQAGFPQYVYAIAPADYPFQAMGAVSGSDYSETSSADTNENNKSRHKAQSHIVDYDRGRSNQAKQTQARTTSPKRSASLETPQNTLHSTPVHHLHHPVLAKTVNGVTVMAYPSYMMGSPALVHVNDGTSESDSVLAELGFLHSPIATGTLTPPETPIASLSCDFNANASIDSLRKN